MAPSHGDHQAKKLLKLVINEIRILLKWLCACRAYVRTDTPPRPISVIKKRVDTSDFRSTKTSTYSFPCVFGVKIFFFAAVAPRRTE